MNTHQSAYFIALTLLFGAAKSLYADEDNTVNNLSIEDLLNVEVTSVSKKAQSLNDAAAAIFVISHEDIKRSGATSIPDALRLAPGLDVARVNANVWAVTSRGFGGRIANKLQVLIDGRSVYNRAFAGVDWENQDVVLEDIDRIEVIRGPGATMWGANAVNGVINIITKSSAQTQGGMLSAGGGNFERGFGSFRYGTKLNENTTARAYVKGFDRSSDQFMPEFSGYDLGNISKYNNWNKQQGGFKLDSKLNDRDELTIQGDVYSSTANLSAVIPDITTLSNNTQTNATNTMGGNLLSRFQRTLSASSEVKLQLYYDGYSRDMGIFSDSRHTLDLDLQHRFMWLHNHEIIWGANYRYGHDHIMGYRGPLSYDIDPMSVNDQLASAFIQDEISWFDNRLKLTFGSKLEHNDYSGFEGQPSAHIMWAPENNHRVWAGVSRAVRTPSRADQHFKYLSWIMPANSNQNLSPFPIAFNFQSNPKFQSENVLTYELGYRTSFKKSLSFDITGFYSQYKDLFGLVRPAPELSSTFNYLNQNILVTNLAHSHSYGVEIASVWQMLDWWRWDMNHSWFHNQYAYSADYVSTGYAASPNHHSSLRGLINVTDNIDFDIWWRYNGKSVANTSFGSLNIPAYFSLDLRSAWRPMRNLELSLTGQNLLQSQHLEYVSETMYIPTPVVRGVYGKVSFSF